MVIFSYGLFGVIPSSQDASYHFKIGDSQPPQQKAFIGYKPWPGCWFQPTPFEKYACQNGNLPQIRDANNRQIFELPPPSDILQLSTLALMPDIAAHFLIWIQWYLVIDDGWTT